MPETTAKSLIDTIRSHRLVEPGPLSELDETFATQYLEPSSLAQELVSRKWLTDYQAGRLLEHGGDGLVLGPYVLLDFLGEGGMGRVYRARHQLMNRLVAVKIIRDELVANEEVLQRFHREIQAVAQVSHPNIVLAHDADSLGRVHFLVMEYVEGTTLSKLLAEGPMPIGQACEFIRQAALGLQHAHEQGLVHRDIKPSNLLLTSKGSTVKILDLGLARLEQQEAPTDSPQPMTRSGQVMGTADYMSPEQALDPRKADARSDIYSLGCTFYHMLTGRPPFPGGSFTQKLLWHQNDKPKAPQRIRAAIPNDLAEVLARMMAKRPDDRYPTAAHVVEAVIPFSSVAARRLLSAGLSTQIPAGAKPAADAPKLGAYVRTQPIDDATYDLAEHAVKPAAKPRQAKPAEQPVFRPTPATIETDDVPAPRPMPPERRLSRPAKPITAAHRAYAYDEPREHRTERPELDWRGLRKWVVVGFFVFLGVVVAWQAIPLLLSFLFHKP